MTEVYNFLKNCKTYYIATADGDQPRVRPFGTIDLFEDKLYIQTGKSKSCFEQMDGKRVEICAFDGERWLRVAATLINDDRREPKAHLLEQYPSLLARYSADDANTAVLYLKDATATFSSFTAAPRTVTF